MSDKMAITAYILKIVEKDLFVRLQMRAKEMFNRHQKDLSRVLEGYDEILGLRVSQDTIDTFGVYVSFGGKQ